MAALVYQKGDHVRTNRVVEHTIPKGTKGVVKGAYPEAHSSFPYDVLFDKDGLSFPVAEYEIEPTWRTRLKKWWRKPAILDAESYFGNEETVAAFQEAQKEGREDREYWSAQCF